MDVLAITHGGHAGAALFGDAVRERGDRLDEWVPALGAPPREPGEYDAALVFGGAMHPDQDAEHPWLRDEDAVLRQLLERGVPTLGVCLGAQLLAKAAGGSVHRAREPEIGWFPVELTDAAADDPLFGSLPHRFTAFEWHEYTYDLPEDATELARSSVCSQAFRVGSATWAIQFHAEVRESQIALWFEDHPEAQVSREGLLEESAERIGAWNELGRSFCLRFLELADRVGATA